MNNLSSLARCQFTSLLVVGLLGVGGGLTASSHAASLILSGTLSEEFTTTYHPENVDPVMPAALIVSVPGLTPPSISYNGVTESINYRLNVPEGQKITIQPYSSPISFYFSLQYYTVNQSPAQQIFTLGTPSVIFNDFVGTPLDVFSSVLATSNILQFLISANVSSPISFTSIDISVPILSGTGPDYDLAYLNAALVVQDYNYQGPGDPLFQMVTYSEVVPETSSLVLLALGGGLLAARFRGIRRLGQSE